MRTCIFVFMQETCEESQRYVKRRINEIKINRWHLEDPMIEMNSIGKLTLSRVDVQIRIIRTSAVIADRIFQR